jgi:hypothetical protein
MGSQSCDAGVKVFVGEESLKVLRWCLGDRDWQGGPGGLEVRRAMSFGQGGPGGLEVNCATVHGQVGP